MEEHEIIEPCYIGPGVIIQNSIIGPNVSIGSGTKILNSKIEGSIIQENTNIDNAKLAKSMIGNNVYYNGKNTPQEVSIGDFCEIK